jgi:hypothetical protein
MSDIVIYEDGTVRLEAEVSQETLWLTQQQIAQLFDVQRPAVTKHLGNIFKSGELDEKVVCSILEHTTKHGAISDKTQRKKIKTYNLDAIISIGYRINSGRATKFRIWATDILKKYILDGYAINKEKLQQQKLKELDATLAMIRQAVTNKELSTTEAKGFVEIIGNYAKSWALLQGYDEQSLEELKGHTQERFTNVLQSHQLVADPKDEYGNKGEAPEPG